MRLRTLGGLALEGTAFARVVPLTLLVYLALEGDGDRTRLCRLFWPAARDPRGALRGALSRVRRAAPGCLEASGGRVRAHVAVDVAELRRVLREGRVDEALRAYGGPFLDGVQLGPDRAELEEWLFETRELIADEVRRAALASAERELAQGQSGSARAYAEAAYGVAGAPPAEPPLLERLHAVLRAGDSPLDRLAHVEAGRYGVRLTAMGPSPRPSVPSVRRGWRPRERLDEPVGRDEEIAHVHALVRDPRERLVTLTGAPGVGKSRLAAAIAEAAGQPGEGERAPVVLQVDAERIGDPGRLADGLAHALGLEPVEEGAALAACADALEGAGATLLVLDGFEHLVDAASRISELLRACPELTLLVASRRPLHLDAERIVRLAPLAHDASDAAGPTLFRARAQRVAPGRVGRHDDGEVLRICRAVGGVPLGIELAASWARALPVAEIAEEVEGTLGFLAAPTRDLPEEERSLRAAVERSWQLLGERHQSVLRRLGAFRGGFRAPEARRVAGADARALAALVDASLLELGNDGRYRLLPAIADLARERLAACPQVAAATRRRHRRAYVEALERWRRDLTGGDRQADALEAIEEELPNLAEAWGEAVASGRGDDLYAMARTVATYFDLARRYRDGADVLARSEAHLDPDDPNHAAARGSLHACWAWTHVRRGELSDARQRAQAAIEVLTVAGDPEGRADAEHAMAAALAREGRPREAQRHAAAARRHAREGGARRDQARLAVFDASLDLALGDVNRARDHLAEAAAAYRAIDDRRGLVRALLAAAELARRTGDGRGAWSRLKRVRQLADREAMADERRRAEALIAVLRSDENAVARRSDAS
jgi:predicted ATPase